MVSPDFLGSINFILGDWGWSGEVLLACQEPANSVPLCIFFLIEKIVQNGLMGFRKNIEVSIIGFFNSRTFRSIFDSTHLGISQ